MIKFFFKEEKSVKHMGERQKKTYTIDKIDFFCFSYFYLYWEKFYVWKGRHLATVKKNTYIYVLI